LAGSAASAAGADRISALAANCSTAHPRRADTDDGAGCPAAPGGIAATAASIFWSSGMPGAASQHTSCASEGGFALPVTGGDAPALSLLFAAPPSPPLRLFGPSPPGPASESAILRGHVQKISGCNR